MKSNNLKITNWLEKPQFPDLEEKVLQHWDDTNAFQQSIDQRPASNPYIFYDGPPFATGLPHYGHLLASTIKDVVPRYWTMKGYRVERVWGWDCHGLPIENIIEKELGLKGGKKGIEELGIGKFNAACRAAILRFDKDWEVIIRRLGRWVDFKNSYKTMDNTYMESVWWAFSQLYEKGLVYQGRKVVLYCPRCATPLSNFEIAMDNSYQDVEDNSVYVKFKKKGTTNEYFLAWTTTPWTLIGNVGLAVQPKAEYVAVRTETSGELLWMAKSKQQAVLDLVKETGKVEQTVLGQELVDQEYERLYDYMLTEDKRAFYVMAADFVSLEDGTGIVHTAAIYGEDDYALALKQDLPCVPTLDDQGKFFPFVTPLANQFYKKSEQWIVDELKSRNLLHAATRFVHSYPFCYRCATPLYYSAVPAWFINVQKMKKDTVAQNEHINWFPDHLKHGRFGKGLETAPDWNISRSRYWGTPMPIWQGEKTGTIRVIQSKQDLLKWAVDEKQAANISDLHREFLDEVQVWVDDTKTEKGSRIPEVFDCWVESGSMPYASLHYPFENKQKFEQRYPAQFISEYIAQTRAWFYTLHTLSVGVFDKPAFENALTTGTILAEDGSKMSKSKKNYPDPMLVVQKYGVDSLRLYLMSSPVMKAENLNFEEKGVDELKKKVFSIWWNVFVFYKLYAQQDTPKEFPTNITHVMDQWIASRTQQVLQEVTEAMDNYDVVLASRTLVTFVNEVSTWYLRQSRDRLRGQESNAEVSQVFAAVLTTLAKMFAPFSPFFSELMYQNMNPGKDSIHLEDWPVFQKKYVLSDLEKEMSVVRMLAEKIHAKRKEAGLKVKQPLAKAAVKSVISLRPELLVVLQQEVNIEQVQVTLETKQLQEMAEVSSIDTVITPELKAKGEYREVVRQIQQLRQDKGVPFSAMVRVMLPSWPAEFATELQKKTLVSELVRGDVAQILD